MSRSRGRSGIGSGSGSRSRSMSRSRCRSRIRSDRVRCWGTPWLVARATLCAFPVGVGRGCLRRFGVRWCGGHHMLLDLQGAGSQIIRVRGTSGIPKARGARELGPCSTPHHDKHVNQRHAGNSRCVGAQGNQSGSVRNALFEGRVLRGWGAATWRAAHGPAWPIKRKLGSGTMLLLPGQARADVVKLRGQAAQAGSGKSAALMRS